MNCRVCSVTPFSQIFGFPEESVRTSSNRQRREQEIVSTLSQRTQDGDDFGFRRATSEERRQYRPRTPEENLTKVAAWSVYVHSRSKTSWMDASSIQSILMKLAESVDKEADPVLHGSQTCVFWHGDISEDTGNGYPIIRMVKPGESTESDVCVTRILAFLFANDESFEALQKCDRVVFPMICDEPLCVNLAHIALEDEVENIAE